MIRTPEFWDDLNAALLRVGIKPPADGTLGEDWADYMASELRRVGIEPPAIGAYDDVWYPKLMADLDYAAKRMGKLNREKHFMLDIESTGVDLVLDVVLEIGIVEMNMVDGFWRPGQEFRQILHTDRQPQSEFAKTHMVELYKKCNAAPFVPTPEVQAAILAFFAGCGKSGHDVLLCGWNAANFDVPMLHAKGFLQPPGYKTDIDGKDWPVGDHHYRIYEMCGALQVASDVLQKPYEEFKEQVKNAYPMPLPEGKSHDALFDCHKQICMLNGLIKVLRG